MSQLLGVAYTRANSFRRDIAIANGVSSWHLYGPKGFGINLREASNASA